MAKSTLNSLSFLCFGVGFLCSNAAAGNAQATASSSAAAVPAVVAQSAAAFAGNEVVQQIQLTGNATWHAGRLEDSGVVSLNASADGPWQMQLSLGTIGTRSESQSGSGSDATCEWVDSDSVAHEILSDNCWKAALWFLPSISLQPSQLSHYLVMADLGTGTVGSSPTSFRHLQGYFAINNLGVAMAQDIEGQSKVDIGLDLTTMLPAVLAYSIRPDTGSPRLIAVEIRFSDYRSISGVQIPFHIQRFINGSLQLDILLTAAQIN